MARSRGGGPRRGGRQTIRGRGNGRSSRTVLTGHKYGEAGKVNRRHLRRERLRGGREAHFTISDTAAALLRQRQEGVGFGGEGEMEQEEEVGEKEGGGRSRRGKWNNGISHVCSRTCWPWCTHSSLTCTVDETLARERPSRSDSRLWEIADDLGALAGAGETGRGGQKQAGSQNQLLNGRTLWPGSHDQPNEAGLAGTLTC